jgi:biotin synthase-related radical SAM superfamily protein
MVVILVVSRSVTKNEDVKESPEYVRTSLAAAMTLKLLPGRFYRDAKLFCINLLLVYDEGCKANCAYCGLSREREGLWKNKSFIRVTWPTYSLDNIINQIIKYQDEIKRICISMITLNRAMKDTIEVIKKIRSRIDIPISILISPTIMKKEDIMKLKNAGADHLGVSVDAARPDLFEKFRGKEVNGPHKWEKYWEIIEYAIKVFEDKVGIHLIVGLGETEEDMIKTIQKAENIGVETHLFSFYPEENSLMSKYEPPAINHYRRIQIARYLINKNITTIDEMEFDDNGKLKCINISDDKLNKIINSGVPFITSGCPNNADEVDCNRPFANEKPGELIRNYPFKPTKTDIEFIKTQFKLECKR